MGQGLVGEEDGQATELPHGPRTVRVVRFLRDAETVCRQASRAFFQVAALINQITWVGLAFYMAFEALQGQTSWWLAASLAGNTTSVVATRFPRHHPPGGVA